MEVVLPLSPDFDFNSSVYPNAPPTPKPMGDYYFSAPTSPTRLTELQLEFDELLMLDDTNSRNHNSLATVPFAWEEKPGVPKSFFFEEENFAFDVSGECQRDQPASAEDLFRGGLIKSVDHKEPLHGSMQNMKKERGRERNTSSLPSSRSRRTRSLPPALEQPRASVINTTNSTLTTTCSTLSASGSAKKWSFMDLFLFRSASDGRAMDRDPLKKYSSIFRKHDEDFRNSSIRSDRSGSGSGSKRRGRVSAHEVHYNVNRAVSNDMKKKTFLPYKQGILGRLAFNPTVQALSNGFGNSHNN